MNPVLIRRAGWRGFDFGREDERAAMARLLGGIVERNHPKSGCMISALVKYLDENDAGPGFYRLSTQMGLLPSGASSKAKEQFWVGQVTCAYERYARSGGAKSCADA